MPHFSDRVHKNWVTFPGSSSPLPCCLSTSCRCQLGRLLPVTRRECGTVLWEAQAAGGAGAVSQRALAAESGWEREGSRSGAGLQEHLIPPAAPGFSYWKVVQKLWYNTRQYYENITNKDIWKILITPCLVSPLSEKVNLFLLQVLYVERVLYINHSVCYRLFQDVSSQDF